VLWLDRNFSLPIAGAACTFTLQNAVAPLIKVPVQRIEPLTVSCSPVQLEPGTYEVLVVDDEDRPAIKPQQNSSLSADGLLLQAVLPIAISSVVPSVIPIAQPFTWNASQQDPLLTVSVKLDKPLDIEKQSNLPSCTWQNGEHTFASSFLGSLVQAIDCPVPMPAPQFGVDGSISWNEQSELYLSFQDGTKWS